MGRRRRKNCINIDGILLLEKPQGLTSNQALQDVKYLFRACKAGHTGSLDPIATGLLPLCFGEGTKVSQFLLDSDKTYIGEFQLVTETDTYDAEGAVVDPKGVLPVIWASEQDLKRKGLPPSTLRRINFKSIPWSKTDNQNSCRMGISNGSE